MEHSIHFLSTLSQIILNNLGASWGRFGGHLTHAGATLQQPNQKEEEKEKNTAAEAVDWLRKTMFNVTDNLFIAFP